MVWWLLFVPLIVSGLIFAYLIIVIGPLCPLSPFILPCGLALSNELQCYFLLSFEIFASLFAGSVSLNYSIIKSRELLQSKGKEVIIKYIDLTSHNKQLFYGKVLAVIVKSNYRLYYIFCLLPGRLGFPWEQDSKILDSLSYKSIIVKLIALSVTCVKLCLKIVLLTVALIYLNNIEMINAIISDILSNILHSANLSSIADIAAVITLGILILSCVVFLQPKHNLRRAINNENNGIFSKILPLIRQLNYELNIEAYHLEEYLNYLLNTLDQMDRYFENLLERKTKESFDNLEIEGNYKRVSSKVDFNRIRTILEKLHSRSQRNPWFMFCSLSFQTRYFNQRIRYIQRFDGFECHFIMPPYLEYLQLKYKDNFSNYSNEDFLSKLEVYHEELASNIYNAVYDYYVILMFCEKTSKHIFPRYKNTLKDFIEEQK